MTVVKVMELVADSPTSWEDAVQKAVSRANDSIENISGVEIKNLTAAVVNGKITEYKANLHLAYKESE
ncbi:MAG TPA: dodecin family protein [Bacillota bacterium]|nr:dodecin family protein [Bacillota bacterium]